MLQCNKIEQLEKENEALRVQLAEVDKAFIEEVEYWDGDLSQHPVYQIALAREQARRSEREAPEVK